MELTHMNEQGRARMVDVSAKADTRRIGVASGRISMQPETFRLITDGKIKKGDVLAVAQVAGIMAAKKTFDTIPMCHPLLITGVDIHFELHPECSEIEAVASVKTTGKTGIEMEALHATAVALLTIYDMCKAVDRGMVIKDILLLEKDGGKSGHFIRSREQ
ncbi:MAG: cyclic pyranopterin monophosphate synthase MoaC [Eubacterium sp.]|jgi:cyclic pyranopterin phosphate synthase